MTPIKKGGVLIAARKKFVCWLRVDVVCTSICRSVYKKKTHSGWKYAKSTQKYFVSKIISLSGGCFDFTIRTNFRAIKISARPFASLDMSFMGSAYPNHYLVIIALFSPNIFPSDLLRKAENVKKKRNIFR